jgi:hypothetical protein
MRRLHSAMVSSGVDEVVMRASLSAYVATRLGNA